MMRAVILAVVLAVSGCAVQSQRLAANALATGANAVAAAAAHREVQEGLSLMRSIESQAEGEAVADAVEARWEPFWFAFDAFADLHAAWVKGLREGRPAGPELLAAVYELWCRLQRDGEEHGIDVPAVIPCGVAP